MICDTLNLIKFCVLFHLLIVANICKEIEVGKEYEESDSICHYQLKYREDYSMIRVRKIPWELFQGSHSHNRGAAGHAGTHRQIEASADG